VTLAGNVGLLQAGDAVTFYSCFAVMTFAAYGLVVHDRTPAAMRAGRVYMALAVVGEAAIFTGLVLATSAAGTTELAALGPAVAAAPGPVADHRAAPGRVRGEGRVVPLHIWLPAGPPGCAGPRQRGAERCDDQGRADRLAPGAADR
jgi:hydrogenase-4 component B